MRKQHIWRALALLLVTAWLLTATAAAVDLDASCTVTVEAGSSEFAEDLASANVVIDLYRVADAEASGADGYTLVPTEPYAGLALGSDRESVDWEALAQEAASIALDRGEAKAVTGAPLGEPISRTDTGAALTAGLYLLVARGADIEDYTATVTNDAGADALVTIALSEDYEYRFLPRLLAMPALEQESESDAPAEEPVPEDETAGDPVADGEPSIVWVYDLDVSLKLDRQPLYGAVEIVKTLRTYAAGEAATFVFDVEASLNGTVLYSNVASLTFTAPGSKTVLLDRVPVGAVVTVREVYSGAHYDLQTAASQTAAVEAGQTARVEFINDYNAGAAGGHGITNNFTFDGETWVWVQLTGNDAG